MTEYRAFDPENPPEWLDSEWWKDTENCNHVDNPVHFARLKAAADISVEAAIRAQTYAITDLGAGDGGLLSLLPTSHRTHSYGYEIITDSVRYANEVRGVEVYEGNVLKEIPSLSRVGVATEMLEHIEDPHGFVRKLYEDPRIRQFVASSPHSEGETPYWNHAWSWDREGYAKLMTDAGWHVVQHFDAEWSQIIWVTKDV